MALEDYLTDLISLGQLLVLINIAEVAIRNAMVRELQVRYGTEKALWYDAIKCRLTPTGKQTIEKTVSRIRSEGRKVTTATVTAGLSLGFWVSLLGSNYEPTLWTKALRNIFVGEPSLNRRVAHRQVSKLLKIRNLAAHHALIYREDFPHYRETVLRIILWISPEGHAWALKALKP